MARLPAEEINLSFRVYSEQKSNDCIASAVLLLEMFVQVMLQQYQSPNLCFNTERKFERFHELSVFASSWNNPPPPTPLTHTSNVEMEIYFKSLISIQQHYHRLILHFFARQTSKPKSQNPFLDLCMVNLINSSSGWPRWGLAKWPLWNFRNISTFQINSH